MVRAKPSPYLVRGRGGDDDNDDNDDNYGLRAKGFWSLGVRLGVGMFFGPEAFTMNEMTFLQAIYRADDLLLYLTVLCVMSVIVGCRELKLLSSATNRCTSMTSWVTGSLALLCCPLIGVRCDG